MSARTWPRGVNNTGWWGEGEIKFYMDGDAEFPTICGTGTEDYFCGSYNFDVGKDNGGYREFTTPYAGLAQVIRPDGLYLVADPIRPVSVAYHGPIRFEKDLRVTIQALGWRSGGRYLPPGRYCLGCVLVSDAADGSISIASGQGSPGGDIARSGWDQMLLYQGLGHCARGLTAITSPKTGNCRGERALPLVEQLL